MKNMRRFLAKRPFIIGRLGSDHKRWVGGSNLMGLHVFIIFVFAFAFIYLFSLQILYQISIKKYGR